MYQVDDYVDKNGVSPFSEWKAAVKHEEAKIAMSRVFCLQHAGLRCPYRKDLKLEQMYELRSKEDGIRVYFFPFGAGFIILGAGFKDTQKQDIADCLERMRDFKQNF